jgi:hypothetical protein
MGAVLGGGLFEVLGPARGPSRDAVATALRAGVGRPASARSHLLRLMFCPLCHTLPCPLPCCTTPCPGPQTNFDARDYTGETIPPLTGKTREEVKTTLKSERIKQVCGVLGAGWVAGVGAGCEERALCAAWCVEATLWV